MPITKTTEWESENVRLVRLDGLPTGDGGYGKRPVSGIRHVYVHQSAGNHKAGIEAAIAIARFHVGDPIYKRHPDGSIALRKNGKKHMIGGGRGWPAAGYTFCIPGQPEIVDGKIEVFRLNPDDRHSYHTGATANRIGAAVCFAGTFASRHMKNSTLTRPAPVETAMLAGKELILDYLMPRYGITPAKGLRGHFDVGKPACPGDALERWVRETRGEVLKSSVPVMVEKTDSGFDSPFARQQALVDLGFVLGSVDGIWGERSKGALLAFQDATSITADGRWGPQTEKAIRAALEQLGAGTWEG